MRYQFFKAVRDTDQLHAELAASGLPGFQAVNTDPAFVYLDFAAELTPAQVTTLTALVDAHAPDPLGPVKRLRAAAKEAFAKDATEDRQTDRAIVLVLLDEINALRDWITQYKAAVAAAGSLAALKTATAALPNVPQRTPQQARTAVLNRMDTADPD
jgi:hypothetical protein